MCHGVQTEVRLRGIVTIRGTMPQARKAMLYTFKSDATGNLIMNGARGDQLLGIIGKPPAPSGIVPVVALPQAIQSLEEAVAAAEARPAGTIDDEEVTLRQRAWPLVDMLRRAQQAQVPVVWGV